MSYDSKRKEISACYSPKRIKSTAVVVLGNFPETSAFEQKKQEVDRKRIQGSFSYMVSLRPSLATQNLVKKVWEKWEITKDQN